MTAIELLQATRDEMGKSGSGIASSLFKSWNDLHTGVPAWNEACRALVAYIDPYAEGVPNCRLYGYIRAFERHASFHTQLDALDFAVEYCGKSRTILDQVIDPRD